MAQPALEPRKRISREKASKQTRAIIVAAPKEEAKMMDIGARPKKRGRPRKNPNVSVSSGHREREDVTHSEMRRRREDEEDDSFTASVCQHAQSEC